MNADYFRTLFGYHYWANERILRVAANLSDAQFIAPMNYSHGGLRGTLVHMLSAEWIWLSRWQGTSPTAMLREQDFPTLAALRTRWVEQEKNMRAFLAGLRDEDLTRIIKYANTRGKLFERPLWHMLAHVVNHGTQHHAEAAAMLTELGHSPGDIDMIYFFD